MRGEATVTVVLPPKLELHCPPLAVANSSLEVTLAGWGATDLDVDWKITKNGVQVAKGGICSGSGGRVGLSSDSAVLHPSLLMCPWAGVGVSWGSVGYQLRVSWGQLGVS